MTATADRPVDYTPNPRQALAHATLLDQIEAALAAGISLVEAYRAADLLAERADHV